MSEKTSRVDELLAANSEIAKSWEVPPTMIQMRQRPQGPVLVLTCMDPRVAPEHLFGSGPKLAVVRNAGGRSTADAIRSITILHSLARDKRVQVMVVHHTDCGMVHLTREEIERNISDRNGGSNDDIPSIDLGLFTAEDLERVVVEDVQTLRGTKLLTGTDVRGFVLSTETGLLREIQV